MRRAHACIIRASIACHGNISYSIEKLNNYVNYVSSIRINIFLSVELLMFSNPLVLTCVLRVRENSLEETVLLSTHNTSHDYSLGRSYEYTHHMFWPRNCLVSRSLDLQCKENLEDLLTYF